MMRCKTLLLGLTLAFALPASAFAASVSEKTSAPPLEQSASRAVQPTENIVQARPALWVVKDADTTIYLLGTIHLLKPQIRWFDGPVRKAFDAAQDVVLEVAEEEGPATQTMLLQRAMQPGLPALSSLLAPAQGEKYLAALKENNVPAELFDHVKPWFAALTLSVLPLQKYGYNAQSGVDRIIRAEAVKSGKTLIGLETSQEQIGFFDSLPNALQLTLLSETLDELPTLPVTIEEMISAWSAGNPDHLAAIVNESVEGNAELRKRLLTDRNARWADWIKARLDKPGTVLIAVGAGHLAGSDSVQVMLKERGISAALMPRD